MWGAASYKRRSLMLAALLLSAIVGSTASDRAHAAADSTPPTIPSIPTTIASTTSSITVTWDPSIDDVGVAGYELYLNEPGTIKPGPLAVATALTQYTLTGLACSSPYKISVDAYDAAGNRSLKAVVVASTTECPAPATTAPTSPTSANAAGRASTSPAAPAPATPAPAAPAPATPAPAPPAPATPAPAAPVSGKAARTGGSPVTTATANDTAPPSSPSGLTNAASTLTTITVAWSPSTDNVGVAGYSIYMNRTNSGKPGPLVGATTATSYTLTGLACGSTYKVSVDAYDAAGNRSPKTAINASTSGCSDPPGDRTPPTVPSGLAKTGSTATSISIAWRPSTDDVGVAGYGIYLSNPGAANRGRLMTSTTSTSKTITGLSCGTPYRISVDAYDAAGNRSPTTTIASQTDSCASAQDTTPPSAPTSEAQTGGTQTTLAMSWSPSTDNVGVTGYRAYLNGAAVGTTTQTTYTYAGLNCGTAYTVAVAAFDAAGNSSNPSLATVQMSTAACLPPADTQPPTTPSGLGAGGATVSAITLNWHASSDNAGVTGYDAYVNGSKVGQSTGLTYTFIGLSCGTVYTLSVDAFDAAGNHSPQASLSTSTAACPTTDNQAPTTPTGLVVTASTQLSITAQWSASSDNVGVTGYGVYVNGALTGTTPSLSYTASGLACGTTYVIGVEAFDAAGNRSSQRTLSAATTPCADIQAPSAPTGLAATTTQTSVSLQWATSTDNVGVAGYGVYKNGALAGNATSTSYTVSGLSCGTSYAFAVDAYDAAGNHSTKTPLSVSTAACTPSGGGTPTVFMSPTGSGTACTQASPCSTVQAAYSRACSLGGATVAVAAGTYNQGDLGSATCANRVIFQPPAGSTNTVVKWGEVHTCGTGNWEADTITLGFNATGSGCSGTTGTPASNITLSGDHIPGADLWIRNANHISVIGGDVCCDPTGLSPTIGNGYPVSVTNRVQDILLDGVAFHDLTRDSNPTNHAECLFIQGVSRITIQNSTFTNCAVMDVYLHAINGEQNPDHVRLLNNVFHPMGPTSIDAGYYTVMFRADSGESINGFDLEGNTFAQPLNMDTQSGATMTGLVQCKNVGSFTYTGLVPPWTTC